MIKWTFGICYVLLLCLGSVVQASSKSFTYQGRILDSSGQPFEYEFAQFKFEIANPTGSCILYREISGIKDMRNSGGIFDVPIGEGTVDALTPSGNTLEAIMKNGIVHPCIGGSNYTAADGHGRLLRVSFRDAFGWQLISPDQEVRGVPHASFAQNAVAATKLDNLTKSDFLQVADTEICAAGEFLRHVAPSGTLVCEAPSASGTVTGLTGDVSTTGSGSLTVTVDRIKGVTVSPAAYSSGQVLRYNGTDWVNAVLSSADLSNNSDLLKASNMPANCSASQTLTFSSPTGTWTCSNITVDLSSKTDAFTIPAGTTAQQPSTPVTGMIRYNTSTSAMELFDGTSWQDVGSGGVKVSPPGLVAPFSTASCPTGWLHANGSAVSRTTYASLFSAIGTMYGPGDGSTTFNLPDYRGYFLRGWNSGSGIDPDAASRTNRGDGTTGDQVGTKQTDEFKSHMHGMDREGAAGGGNTIGDAWGSGSLGNYPAGTGTAYSGGNETRPKNVNVIYCISTATNSATTVTSSGSGTTNYIPRWTSSTALGDSPIAVSGSNVGVGTPTPAARLDVAGEIKLGNTSSTCNATNEGQQRYNSTLKKMEFCDGVSWKVLGGGYTGSLWSCPCPGGLVYILGVNASGWECFRTGWYAINSAQYFGTCTQIQ